jgi:hypothetical protein
VCYYREENNKSNLKIDFDYTLYIFYKLTMESIEQKSEYVGISKGKDVGCKQGFIWRFKVRVDGQEKRVYSNINYDKVVEFAKEWHSEMGTELKLKGIKGISKKGDGWRYRCQVDGRTITIKHDKDYEALVEYATQWKIDNNYHT